MGNENNKVLIIEDDSFLADLLSDHLRKNGLNVDLAQDGEKGLAKALETPPPSLILLDLLLPGITGYEVLEKLNGDKPEPPMPVIILSNLGQQEEIERGMKLGAKDFLIKAHLDLDEITAKVKEFLHIS